jgi:hypothetical protein
MILSSIFVSILISITDTPLQAIAVKVKPQTAY